MFQDFWQALYFHNSNAAKFTFKSIYAKQIREALGKLKTSKSFGDDGISSYLLKLAMPFIEDSLVHLYNTSLETSLFPDPWKIARVLPIFKDGAVNNSTTSMYADDTSLCLQSKDLSRLNEAVNEDLAHLDTWLTSHKLSLNVAKTQSMLVSTKAKRNVLNMSNQNLQIKIHGTELEAVNKIKYLGVKVDNSLDWKSQVQATS